MLGAFDGPRQLARSLWPLAALLALGALPLLSRPLDARQPLPAHRPLELRSQRYVSSRECRSCHPGQYASWHDSFHRRMTAPARPEEVIPRFEGVTLGGQYALGREGAAFHVDVLQPGAAPERHPIALVTGSHHMQIFWYETGHDRSLGQLPYVYLNADRRWVPRNAIFIEPPAPLTAAASGRWNASCIACHTTLGQPRIDAQGQFDTQVAELGVACEACHGPGEEHIAHNQSPLARYARRLRGVRDSSIVQPAKLPHDRASYVCAQCHSTTLFDGPASMRDWNEHGPRFRPGEDRPASQWLLQPSRAADDPRIAGFLAQEASFVASQFWSDGVMRVSGREFNGMVDSACYQKSELSCSSCHSMHQADDDPRPRAQWRAGQLAEGMDGDRACHQCHAQYGEQHTRHAASSEGSRCVNCHMPYTSWGLLKALRSHRIDVPSVRATLEAGRPNACNLCHLDKSLAWTAEQLHERVPDAELARTPVGLWLGLSGDAGQRALIGWALGWAPARAATSQPFAAPLLGVLLDDPYDAVRYVASHALTARGVSPDRLGYDFLTRPEQRPPALERVVDSLHAPFSPEERARFARLLSERDTRPVRLLE